MAKKSKVAKKKAPGAFKAKKKAGGEGKSKRAEGTQEGGLGAAAKRLKVPPPIAKLQSMVDAAVLRNQMASRVVMLNEQLKIATKELVQTPKGREYDKCSGKIMSTKEAIKICIATEAAAVEKVLAMTLAMVGEGLFKPQDRDAGLFIEKVDSDDDDDLPGQLKIHEADLGPTDAAPDIAELPGEGQRITLTAKAEYTGLPQKVTGIVTSRNDRAGSIVIKPDESGAFEVRKVLDNYTFTNAA